jgi:TatD DNase family protein
MKFIDTHTHLYSEEFNQDRIFVIQKAINNGINKFYLPNIDSSSVEGMHELELEFPNNCFAMMGLHPCSVNENFEEELLNVQNWLKKRKYSAIGEIRIDLFWDKTFLKEQKIAFEKQIKWAIEYDYSIIIHCREAFDEVFDVLSLFKNLPKGIFHCFTGNIEQAEKIIQLQSFKLGIGGVLTFKNSGLDKVIENIDLVNLVLETDAPYLSPIPFRGKRNEPIYLLEIAKKLAEIKNISVSELAEITSKNAEFIFK